MPQVGFLHEIEGVFDKEKMFSCVSASKNGEHSLDFWEVSYYRGKGGVQKIGQQGFEYTVFEEEEDGGMRKVIYGYPYLKHIIYLLPGYWEQYLGKMNESVCDQNLLQQESRKTWAIKFFPKNEPWKFIGCILLTVTYGKKGYRIWEKVTYIKKQEQMANPYRYLWEYR